MSRDFAVGATIGFKFNTRTSAGAPITLAGTPAVAVYKRGSTTESAAGVTLTVDYDSKTGLHNVLIDTSADGTFYSTASDFDVVLSAGTVDSVSVVGTVIYEFSLANRPVQSLAANTVTASALATDAVSEIQSGLSTLDAAGVRTAVGLASANLDTQLSTIDDFLDTEVAAIKAKTDNLPASPAAVGSPMTLASGAITAAVIATDAIDADAIATDAVAEIQSGLSTLTAAGVRSAVGMASADLDTQLDAILAAAGSSGQASTVMGRVIELSLGPDDTKDIFELVKGDVYTIYATLKDSGGDPLNLTGYTITALVTDATNTEIDAPSCALVSAAHGIISIAITTDVTGSALALGYLSVKTEYSGTIMTTTPRKINVKAR